MQLFEWATEHVEIKCFYVSFAEVIENEELIANRMQSAIPIQGTRNSTALFQ
jgi:hypothetical protein